MFKKLSFVSLMLFLSIALSQCKVLFVPPSSPDVTASVVQLSENVNSFYDGMITGNDKTFDGNEQGYVTIGNAIDAIAAKDAVRPHAGNIQQQVAILRTTFDKYKGDHRIKVQLDAPQLKVYKAYMQAFIKPILVSELSLKSLK